MDLTRDNFEELYPELENAINECDFCAIDGEFSGVAPYRDLNALDTPKTRYERMRKYSDNYLLMQFGLCIFKKIDDSSYEAKAYNCYLYPRSNEKSRFCKSIVFSCLNSSIEFLSEQNFDFNKVFCKGIPYISKEHEEHTRERIMQAIEANNNGTNTQRQIAYPHNKKEEILKIMEEIDGFMQNEEEAVKEFKLTDYLARKFAEKNLRNKYAGKMNYEYKNGENKEQLLTIRKIKKDEVHADLVDLNKEIGFSKLMWLFSKTNKLMVGHNIITDLIETLKHFFGALPNEYDDFKLMAHSIFPNIIDTKHMATTPPLKELVQQSNLMDLHLTLSEKPFSEVNILNCKYNVNSDKLHEAGFDAFLTGYCYVRMLNYLEKQNVGSSRQSIISPYLNKLHLMKTFDTAYMDLVNTQEIPNRDNVFFIEFPSFWDDQDLYNLFEPFGKIFISWNNKTSAFVVLKTVENLKKATSQLVGVSGREYRVYFYKTYVNQLSKRNDDSGIKKRRVDVEGEVSVDPEDLVNGNRFALLAKMNDDDMPDSSNEPNKNKRIKTIEQKNKSAANTKKLFEEVKDWSE